MSDSDDNSRSDESVTEGFLESIARLDKVLRDLKQATTDDERDSALVAARPVIKYSFEVLGHDQDEELEYLDALNAAKSMLEFVAAKKHDNLAVMIFDYDSMEPGAFWSLFHHELAVLERTSVDFRKKCLHRTFNFETLDPYGYESNSVGKQLLFNEVCKMNPPVNILKKLIEIIPEIDGEFWDREYNHLARVNSASDPGEFPLHTVIRTGGSIELVRVLIEADDRLGTSLKPTSDAFGSLGNDNSPLLLFLVANQDQYRPEEFSKILRLIALSYPVHSAGRSSALLHRSEMIHTEERRWIPLEMFWCSLKESGLSNKAVLQNDDFVFLLRATCYYFHSRNASYPLPSYDEKVEKVEQISLSRAFLVCSPFFEEAVIREILPQLFSNEPAFLLGKDSNGKHPIHAIITSHFYGEKYFAHHDPQNYANFKEFMVGEILKLAPQCARIVDEGRLPLHTVADTKSNERDSDKHRLSLVRLIINACPEAASVFDRETGLPPFALPLRKADSYVRKANSWGNPDASISSAFFLLRMSPDVLLGPIANGKKVDANNSCSSAKRQKVAA